MVVHPQRPVGRSGLRGRAEECGCQTTWVPSSRDGARTPILRAGRLPSITRRYLLAPSRVRPRSSNRPGASRATAGGCDVRPRRASFAESSITPQGGPHGCHHYHRDLSGRNSAPAIYDRDRRGGTRGSARAGRGDSLARQRDRRGSFTGGAIGNHSGTRALLGD